MDGVGDIFFSGVIAFLEIAAAFKTAKDFIMLYKKKKYFIFFFVKENFHSLSLSFDAFSECKYALLVEEQVDLLERFGHSFHKILLIKQK